MSLVFIHLGEGGKKVLQMLGGSRIAMGNFGPMYESHIDGFKGGFVFRGVVFLKAVVVMIAKIGKSLFFSSCQYSKKV